MASGLLVSLGLNLRDDIAADVRLRLLVAAVVAAPAVGCAWWGLRRVRATGAEDTAG